jgi:hypothetical protein
MTMLEFKLLFLANFMSIFFLVCCEDTLKADEKFLKSPMNSVLYIHGFDQIAGYEGFSLIPLDIEHLLPIRIYKPKIGIVGPFHRLRISYKINGSSIEEVVLTVKMKFIILPKRDPTKNISDIMLIGRGNFTTTIFFGYRIWFESSHRFYCEQANILAMVSTSQTDW